MDWTFRDAPTRSLTHCYHDYPARMIPQVAGQLLDLYAGAARLLFDPYCGSGTCLVEGSIRGIDGIGTDLNPLARLIARAKVGTPDLKVVDREVGRFERWRQAKPSPGRRPLHKIAGIPRLRFWFKPRVIGDLDRIRSFVDEIEAEPVRLFFQVAFSETVRACSNSRAGEFKLYRYDAAKLKRFNPDVLAAMSAKLMRNRNGLGEFLELMRRRRKPRAIVRDFNTVEGIPVQEIAPGIVDIVVTSPPYGDSQTTVAYGQYSRLSAAWLGLAQADKIDRRLMGGSARESQEHLPCPELRKAISLIGEVDEERARGVSAFYQDLFLSISHVARVIRAGGSACYVVGNRRVKGVVLPTDLAVRSFFHEAGFAHVATFHRSIPNKRMPLRNSPTNVRGAGQDTMREEHIVVMRKAKSR